MYSCVQLPFPIFKLAKYPYPIITALVIEMKVIPGQAMDWEGMFKVAATQPVPSRSSFFFKPRL